ncbi:MAG: threonine--tRNA ligase, partial [Candidatus Zixiibacteriota bacterium]
GDPEDWLKAEDSLRLALEKQVLDYIVDEGEGAVYGPKVDIKIKDPLGRAWQGSTIQFDFSLPERFDLAYTDSDGQKKRPFMVHRALLGSIERFFGVLIEHYAGNFPLWLAPVQVAVLPISDEFNEYAGEIVHRLKDENIRVELDDRSEKIGAKIRTAELMKTPYMFILGAKEAEAGTVSVRKHGQGDMGARAVDEAIASLNDEIVNRGLRK